MPTGQPSYSGISPQFVGDSVPNLVSHGLRPYVLTGFLVQHFRQHFADPSLIEEPSLRRQLWGPGDDAGIVVDSATLWDPARAMKRPAVLVKRGAARVTRLGIGDRCMGFVSYGDGYDYYLTFLVGSHVIFCLGSEAGEAERLSSEVYRELVQFGPIIREALCLHRFVITEIGELGRLPQEAAGGYVVPVTVAYAYEEFWRIEPQVPVLQGVSIGTNI